MDFNDKAKLDASRVKTLKKHSRGVQLILSAKDKLDRNSNRSPSHSNPKKEYFQTKTIAGPSDHVTEGRRDKSRALQNAATRKMKKK